MPCHLPSETHAYMPKTDRVAWGGRVAWSLGGEVRWSDRREWSGLALSSDLYSCGHPQHLRSWHSSLWLDVPKALSLSRRRAVE